MHGLTDIVVATEGETQVTHTAADMGTRQVLSYPFRRTDEVGSIGIMLLHAGGNGKDIGVEDNIQWIHPHPFGQYLVGPLGNGDTTLITGGLSFLIEAHHHHGSPIAHGILGMLHELRLTLFQ